MCFCFVLFNKQFIVSLWHQFVTPNTEQQPEVATTKLTSLRKGTSKMIDAAVHMLICHSIAASAQANALITDSKTSMVFDCVSSTISISTSKHEVHIVMTIVS